MLSGSESEQHLSRAKTRLRSVRAIKIEFAQYAYEPKTKHFRINIKRTFYQEYLQTFKITRK